MTITLDPSSIISSSGVDYYGEPITGLTPVTVQVGDEVTGTVTFTDGPVLIDDPSYHAGITLSFFSSPTTYGGGTDSIDFLGLAGTTGTADPTEGAFNDGAGLVAEYANGPNPADFSFTGFTYTIYINSVPSGSLPLDGDAEIYLQGQTVAFGETAPPAAPEPAGLGLCGIGCAALGWVRRHQNKKGRG
jgi:hypothetical protein